jgi:hypothetical protein
MVTSLPSSFCITIPLWRCVLLQGRRWSPAWQRRGGWTWGRIGRRTSTARPIPWWGTNTGWRATPITTARAVPTCADPETTTLDTTSVPPPVTASVSRAGRATTALNVSVLHMSVTWRLWCGAVTWVWGFFFWHSIRLVVFMTGRINSGVCSVVRRRVEVLTVIDILKKLAANSDREEEAAPSSETSIICVQFGHSAQKTVYNTDVFLKKLFCYFGRNWSWL